MSHGADIRKTKAELLEEIQALRERLHTSEETLNAIQTGGIDALVVSTPHGPRIFTLATADQSYRLLVEEMQQGAAFLSAEGLVLYCNQSLARLLQQPIEKLIGSYLQQYLSLQDTLIFQSGMKAVSQGQRMVMDLLFLASNAVEIPAFMTINLIKVDETLMYCIVITDLTEQKCHEETMAAERLARLILEQAGEAILVCSLNGTIIRASQVACELWGQTLLWKPFHTLAMKPTLSIPSIIEGESIQGLEVEMQDPHGRQLNLILSARPLADIDSQPLGAVVILTDITDRKRIETQRHQALEDLEKAKAELEQRVAERTVELRQINAYLQHSESTLRSFFDSAVMPMGIVEIENDDILHLSDNGAAAQFFGTSSQAIKNQFSSCLGVPQATIQRWLTYCREAEQSQTPVHFEYRQEEIDGGRWLSGSVCFISVSDNGNPCFSYILEDITERKQAEEALAQKEEQLRLSLDFAHIGIWDWDLRQNIMTWNDNHFKLLGLDTTKTKDLYQHWRSAIHSDDLDRVEQAIHQALDQHIDYESEYRIVRPDGSLRWMVGKGHGLYDEDQVPIRMLGAILDISDRKEAQEKIQASLQEKELLLKEVYHRVKNNLYVIYGLLSLQARSVSDPAVLTALRDSQSRVKAMSLVHEKLYQSSDLNRINISEYIQSLLSSLLETYRINSNNIHLNLSIEPYNLDLEQALPCGLILTELMSNSLKYAFPNGSSGEICVELRIADQQVALRFSDNGIGLPSHLDLRHVSSLGLSLVQNLAKQLKGEITLIPQTIGTGFQLIFPR
ncbi:MAG: hypothetical protein RLZZ597_1116 [Cyanobacteriota bacterium]|jgi:PAS domain S-box-containing protein